MNARMRWVVPVTATLALLAAVILPPPTAFAAGPQIATAVSVGAPATAALGDQVFLQAVLIDATGTPVPDVVVVFTSPATFLNAEGELTLATARTDDQGLAATTYQLRRTGDLTVRAEFRGDARHLPSQASTAIAIGGTAQLYDQSAGVQIPALSVPPASGPLHGLAGWWPNLSGWPIALTLIVVWSLYAFVAGLIVLISAAGADAPTANAPPAPPGRTTSAETGE